jgi:SAM-dependent methyltransferase
MRLQHNCLAGAWGPQALILTLVQFLACQPMPATRSHPPADMPPSPWVASFLTGVAPGQCVLDVACGAGRHVRLALQRGLTVTAIDRDTSRLGDLPARPDVEVITADLEGGAPFPPAGRTFAGVIVTNYLWRPILPAIGAAVAPDGMLIYETFALGHERHGGRPSNPDFLLRPNELAEVAITAGLIVIAFEHVREDHPRSRIVQRIAAVGPGHPWVAAPPPHFTP